MIEIPEAHVLAGQLNQTIVNKTIARVITNQSPHKFAFFSGDPAAYHDRLAGKRLERVEPIAGQIEWYLEDLRMVMSDGVNLRYFPPGEKGPVKNQLSIDFSDSSSLVTSVQMYGMMWLFKAGENDNPYYLAAKEKPSPLTDAFDWPYFSAILEKTKPTLAVKGLLATEQRIPGLGNGVLQDILFNARVNPRRKLQTLRDEEKIALFTAVKGTLQEMTAGGGRDTEKDIFGTEGGYHTRLSSKTFANPCPRCGGNITKEAFLGGSVYYCSSCQL